MRSIVTSTFFTDDAGNPTGGTTWSRGFTIGWQNGPLGPIGRGDDRDEPNGAFVEDVIVAAIDRLYFFQQSKFKCRENEDAIGYLQQALERLDQRTADREAREVEGTYEI